MTDYDVNKIYELIYKAEVKFITITLALDAIDYVNQTDRYDYH